MSPVRLSSRPQHIGATRLELILVVLLIALISGWLLHTLKFYQEVTEKTVVESTVANMRSGLRFKIADLMLKGNAAAQSELAGTNPVQYLESPPAGYLGELRSPGSLPPGSWYFDQDKREVVYIPALKRHLQHEAYSTTGNARLRWQIRAEGNEGGGAWVEVKLLTPYQWF